jgi:hypothetical protein
VRWSCCSRIIRVVICNEFASKNIVLNFSRFEAGIGLSIRGFGRGGEMRGLDTRELGGIDK